MPLPRTRHGHRPSTSTGSVVRTAAADGRSADPRATPSSRPAFIGIRCSSHTRASRRLRTGSGRPSRHRCGVSSWRLVHQITRSETARRSRSRSIPGGGPGRPDSQHDQRESDTIVLALVPHEAVRPHGASPPPGRRAVPCPPFHRFHRQRSSSTMTPSRSPAP